MRRTPSPAAALAERLCRPQRVGVFGHRGVGKTTLLTMLYRESVGGRLPGLRLAAADARTANHLSDKILQLEAGRPLPATLAETDLRFNLHHNTGRLELLMKDYQGEHVEVGRVEPIGDFLRDCDAVWLCLDAATVSASADRLKRQQEVEQLVEQYLAVDPDRILVTPSAGDGPTGRNIGRPVALMLTKADLLADEGGDLNQLAEKHFDMVRHALQTHGTQNGLFAVSSLGTPLLMVDDLSPPPPLNPRNLAEPLHWLATALAAQDEARLNKIWELAPNDLRLLSRCTACFAHRYPDSPLTPRFKARLRQQTRKLLGFRLAVAVGTAAALIAALFAYDALGYHAASRFEQEHQGQPRAVAESWQGYRVWHPTARFLDSELPAKIRHYESAAALEKLRQLETDPTVPPEEVMREFRTFRAAYPEVEVDDDLKALGDRITRRRQYDLETAARVAYAALLTAEQKMDDPLALLSLTDGHLRDFAGTSYEQKFRDRLQSYLARLDDQAIDAARRYSRESPTKFRTRMDLYQAYLNKHPDGAFAAEAREALARIDEEWDKHDFRHIRELYVTAPGNVDEISNRCLQYASVHPKGRYIDNVRELLRWVEQVKTPNNYYVVVRSGSFDKKVAHFFSRGPDLAVEFEVNGRRYGPSPVAVNNYAPDWDYQYPRPIVWKLGDPIRIRVIDHDWGERVVVEYASAENDPLTIHMLGTENQQGRNVVRMECTYRAPVLPNIE